jgi:hypothetical protein
MVNKLLIAKVWSIRIPLWSYNFMYVVPVYLYRPTLDPSLLLALGMDSRSS